MKISIDAIDSDLNYQEGEVKTNSQSDMSIFQCLSPTGVSLCHFTSYQYVSYLSIASVKLSSSPLQIPPKLPQCVHKDLVPSPN